MTTLRGYNLSVKRFSSLLLILFGLPFLGCGLWLLLTLAGALVRLHEIRTSWVEVPATVVAHESIVLGIRRAFHRPTVRYAYERDGVRHESTRHDLLQAFPLLSRSLGRMGRLPYAVGQTVTARVDPKEPGESVLSLELQYATFLGPAALIFLLIGGAFVVGPPLAAWRRAGEARDRERGILAPRFEASQSGLGALTGVALLITLMTGLVLTEAGAWSVPAAILVAAFAAGFGALARLFLRERARRRPFTSCRLILSGSSWTLSDPRRRLKSPAFELAFREESRSMGEDGPGSWTGSDLVRTSLASTPSDEGWRGTVEKDAAQPPPVEELLRRRYWAVRIRDGGREGIFPL